jgi:hypothetical protein
MPNDTTFSAPGNQDDEQLLEGAFQAATEAIEGLVSAALQRGLKAGALALFVERSFEGQVQAICGSRADVERRVDAHEALPPEVRRALVAKMYGRAFAGIPVVLLAHGGEGTLSAGIKHVHGQLVGLA